MRYLSILFLAILILSACTAGGAGSSGSEDAPVLNQAFVSDFTGIIDGTPAEYGLSGAVDKIKINPDGVIETINDGSWATFGMPDTGTIDRNSDGGVTVSWKVKYPAWDGLDWKERNKLSVNLIDELGDPLLEVLFKPYYAPKSTNPNIFLSVNGDQKSTHTLSSNLPYGESANWIAFRLEIEPVSASGGSGAIRLYYDEEDDGIFDTVIDISNEEFDRFYGITFTHRNGKKGDYYYQLMLKEIRIAF